MTKTLILVGITILATAVAPSDARCQALSVPKLVEFVKLKDTSGVLKYVRTEWKDYPGTLFFDSRQIDTVTNFAIKGSPKKWSNRYFGETGWKAPSRHALEVQRFGTGQVQLGYYLHDAKERDAIKTLLANEGYTEEVVEPTQSRYTKNGIAIWLTSRKSFGEDSFSLLVHTMPKQ